MTPHDESHPKSSAKKEDDLNSLTFHTFLQLALSPHSGPKVQICEFEEVREFLVIYIFGNLVFGLVLEAVVFLTYPIIIRRNNHNLSVIIQFPHQ